MARAVKPYPRRRAVDEPTAAGALERPRRPDRSPTHSLTTLEYEYNP
ncbi:hypothetical protein [Natronorubrum halophilum]|nr:hypothetical protein [Natronorubrum halophilum]